MDSRNDEMRKIGAGHASAMARQGLRELRGAFYPDSNVAQQPEYGLYGTLTPGEIAADRQGVEPQNQTPDQERSGTESVIAERLREAQERQQDRGRENREPTLDR